MKNSIRPSWILLALPVLLSAPATLSAQGTTFSYQGRLTDDAGQAQGLFDFRFAVHDADTDGTQVGNAVTNLATVVINGLFSATVDPGTVVFTGPARWLEIAVRTNGGGAFTSLSPRQALTPAPYAIFAPNAGAAATATTAGSVTAGSVTGAGIAGSTILSNHIAPGQVVKSLNTLKDDVVLAAGANISITPNGNTLQLSASDGTRWSLTGNAGTTPGVNFLGTTDNQPLVIRVNGQDAMRYEPTTDTPNVVGGWMGNYVQPGLLGVMIGGGGTSNLFNGSAQPNVVTSNGYYATIAGGYNNTVQGYGGVVVGGSVHSVVGNFGVIGGGQFHRIEADATYSAIGGGYQNLMNTNAQGAVVAGGALNTIERDTFASSIGGGYGNTNSATFGAIGGGILNSIERNNSSATIAGGNQNVIRENVYFGFIGGGNLNEIRSGSGFSVIGGGSENGIDANAGYSVIGGGWLNLIQPGADQSVVAGGNANQILSGSRESFLGGGFANVIQTNAAFSFIGAGTGNSIGTNSTWGTIAGGADNAILSNATHAVIGAGRNNTSASRTTTIGGGEFNRILGPSASATIGGGTANSISNNAPYSTISGGLGNRIADRSDRAFIGGGERNVLGPFGFHGVIGGGLSNSILFNANWATIGGGRGNSISPGGSYSFIGGGQFNTNSGFTSLVSGGRNNVIGSLADHSVIAGGGDNQVTGSLALPVYAVIGGGQYNSVQSNSIYPVISGGLGNTVRSNAQYATIPGGSSNVAAGRYSFAAGRRAQAIHDGAFAWADSTDADFASTTSNQFNVRATGGVRFETGGAGATIDGQQLLSGIVPSASISGTYSGPVTFNNSADSFTGSFTGNGAGLSDVNALTLGGIGSNGFWKTGGNAGTTAAANFIGTTDNQPLTVKVNGATALRIEPTATVPNIIGGLAAFRPTVVGNNVQGAVVAGGNAPAGPVIGNGAGDFHAVFDSDGAIGGGFGNKVGTDNNYPDDAPFTTIAGGVFNSAANYAATVAGGDGNFAGGSRSIIGGGARNQAMGDSALVGGGNNNQAQSPYSAIGGGQNNVATDAHAAVAGGGWNTASGVSSFVGGGGGDTFGGPWPNTAAGNWSAIVGGWNNTASGYSSAIGGGGNNLASGLYAVVPGGDDNQATGSFGFAAGRSARATHPGAFVWADSSGGAFSSSGDNQFSIRAQGGVRLNTDTSLFFGSQMRQMINLGSANYGIGVQTGTLYQRSDDGFAWFWQGTHSNNQFDPGAGGAELMRLDSGGNLNILGVYGNLSDRDAKQNFEPVNAREMLDRVAALPLAKWSYKTDTSHRHIGPMAQDFHAVFGVGIDDKHIATVDADGVALAAIQGLNEKLESQMKAKEERIAELENRLAALERLLGAAPAR